MDVFSDRQKEIMKLEGERTEAILAIVDLQFSTTQHLHDLLLRSISSTAQFSYSSRITSAIIAIYWLMRDEMATSLPAQSSTLDDGYTSQTEPAVFDLSGERGVDSMTEGFSGVCSLVILSPSPNLTGQSFWHDWGLVWFRFGIIWHIDCHERWRRHFKATIVSNIISCSHSWLTSQGQDDLLSKSLRSWKDGG